MDDDKLALAKLDQLTANDFQAAFLAIREDMADSDLSLLKAHYQ
jgi:hypothetical protein